MRQIFEFLWIIRKMHSGLQEMLRKYVNSQSPFSELQELSTISRKGWGSTFCAKRLLVLCAEALARIVGLRPRRRRIGEVSIDCISPSVCYFWTRWRSISCVPTGISAVSESDCSQNHSSSVLFLFARAGFNASGGRYHFAVL